MTFEDNVTRLEQIVAELEADGLELEAALKLFEEGVERLRSANAELARAEANVKLLVENAEGGFELPDFRA